MDLLKHWNLDARADSAPAAIFNAWFLQLAPTIVGDELGDYALSSYQGRFSHVTRFLMTLLGGSGNQAWCDDVRTPEQETCDEDVTKALHDGVASLAAQLGADEARWRWDAVHHAVFPHQGLDTVPVLHTLLSRTVPNGGDWSTVDVGPVDVDHPYAQISIPGYRQIVDLSPANDGRFLDAVGESGHFLSSHYDDFLKNWRDVTYRRMRMGRADVESGAIGHLRLVPK
jgi:penicillin amidase